MRFLVAQRTGFSGSGASMIEPLIHLIAEHVALITTCAEMENPFPKYLA